MPSYNETLSITTEILRRHVLDRPEIKPTDHIQNDLGLDSLGVMELIAEIEDRFEVAIPNEMLAELSTVEQVAKALLRLQESRA